MVQNWRWTFIAIATAVLLSIYVLVPTLMGWAAPEDDESRNELPVVAKLFPSKGLNLGLDLRGGIYIEFDVDIQEALNTRADILEGELRRLLNNRDVPYSEIKRIPDSLNIEVTTKNASERDQVYTFVFENFDGVLSEERDLRSDTQLVYTVAPSFIERTKDLTMRQAVETIRNRIDKYGVTEPTIQRMGENRIAVELPGVRDPDRAITLIKRGGKLEFQMVDQSLTQSKLQQMVREIQQQQGIESYSDEDVLLLQEALQNEIPEDTEVLFQVAYDPVTKKVTGGTPYLLKRKAEITGDMLADAQVQVQGNEPYVSLTFNDIGAEAFAELTGANIGKPLAIVLDDRVSSAPIIQSRIPNGRAQITLGYGNYQSLLREAEDLTLVLREGALPAQLIERNKTIIGPSLGKLSIEKAAKALLLGGALVVIFMMVYYKLSGIFATIALAINVLLIFAILTLFQATLTLPGLAGIILTIGMAVDANIIVFERIREEIRVGKKPRAAVQAGYSNAMSAIIDANVTTFLAGVVLYQFGTGPIRGFAVTLMIGIVTTLFTALFVTKAFQLWNVFVRDVERVSI